MNRVDKAFREAKALGEGALIAYITCGDPEPSLTPKIAEALINGGADVIELGIPFSDPIADGPTIQASAGRALRAGTTPPMVFQAAREIREKYDAPLAVLTYYNPVFRMGLSRFFEAAKRSGIDAVLVPDLPVEEADEYRKLAEAHGVYPVFFASPSTSTLRLRKIVECTRGFLYLISVFGVTGEREGIQGLTVKTIGNFLPYTRDRVPLAVGFGVSKPEQAKALLKAGADGIIVGSALVRVIESHGHDVRALPRELEEKTKDLKGATLPQR